MKDNTQVKPELKPVGATAAEWDMMIKAGLSECLLPCIQGNNIRVSRRSQLKHFGKTPSVFNRYGEATGFAGWTAHVTTPEEIARWRKESRYGICVRTGVGVIAFDCDCDDAQLASDIKALFFSMLYKDVPLRVRGNAPRWLAPVRFKGEFRKRRILFRDGNMLEVLGTGQQFAAAGTHPSGERYAWTDDIARMPAVGIEQVEAFLAEVQKRYGVENQPQEAKGRKKGKTVLKDDPLADWLRDNGYVIEEKRPGELQIICPWEHEHSMGEAGDTSTTYYQAGTNGHSEPAFKCLHGHCAERNIGDFIAWAVSQGYQRSSPLEFPVIEGQEEPEAKRREALHAVLGPYFDEKKLKFESCLPAVAGALEAGAWYTGFDIRFDTFRGTPVTKINGEWEELTDALQVRVAMVLEGEKQFKPINPDLLRRAILFVADKLKFDSMVEYLDARVPTWDGVDRVSHFFRDYCRGEDRPYEQAVAKYIFSALWGRAYTPTGIKADIVPILVGQQGVRKSTLVQTLAFEDRFSGEISFASKDDDIIRRLRGKITVEVPELSGMRKREAEEMKRFISVSSDEHVQKYQEHAQKTVRRCLFMMTTNEEEFLTDGTGNRRYAPVRVGAIDINAVKRDLPQLWAQGREIFRVRGIDHRAVEVFSVEENERFMKSDPWTESVQEWLLSEPKDMDGKPVVLTGKNILLGALGLPAARVGVVETRRLGAVMRELGYTRKSGRVNRMVTKVYVKNEAKDDVPF